MLANAQTTTLSPQEGPQTEFFTSEADIVIYGGSAGGGKTFAIVLESTRHIGNSGFRAGIFRRTYPQLKGQGGIWDEANPIYRGLGAKMREGQELDASFPSGANIAFLHLQHEKTKYEYQGHQFALLCFDELTHFTKSQFTYMLSRNRSSCGIRPYVRATCNPDAGSWVAEFISWWIDQDSGLPIPERSGAVRYFVMGSNDEFTFADSKQELIEQFEGLQEDEILSLTFIPASLDDNPALLERDPTYRAKLRALPKVERERLLRGNWKAAEGAIVEKEWIRRWHQQEDDKILINYQGVQLLIPRSSLQRIATIDTAGTSKEKQAEAKGDPASWSVCGVWDIVHRHIEVIDGKRRVFNNLLMLRHIYREQAGWNELKSRIPEVLENWDVKHTYIENAHYGKPLKDELKGFQVSLVGPVIPGMDDTSRGAKLERAIASGMLSMLEDGKVFVPAERSTWLDRYLNELLAWTGLPKETADQIDVTSYACWKSKKAVASWGGVVAR